MWIEPDFEEVSLNCEINCYSSAVIWPARRTLAGPSISPARVSARSLPQIGIPAAVTASLHTIFPYPSTTVN